MSEICIENFKESAKAAQRYILIACTTSLTLYLLATIKDLKKIKVIDMEVDALPGIIVFFLIYFGSGCMTAIQINRMLKNYRKIKYAKTKEHLMLSSSIVCGHVAERTFAVATPVILFGVAMNEAYGGIVAVALVVYLFSIPYLIALGSVWDFHKKAKERKINKLNPLFTKLKNLFKKDPHERK